ncbi:VWA domain-containing protein [Microbacterium sp. YY-01]|uniref:vWA domain-containing protein n=1 Tax=Microbacterium sp. YY-01 TaxID=3421634 RepID=UPI003D178A82
MSDRPIGARRSTHIDLDAQHAADASAAAPSPPSAEPPATTRGLPASQRQAHPAAQTRAQARAAAAAAASSASAPAATPPDAAPQATAPVATPAAASPASGAVPPVTGAAATQKEKKKRRPLLLGGAIAAIALLAASLITVSTLVLSNLNPPPETTADQGSGLDIMKRLAEEGPVEFLPDTPAAAAGAEPCTVVTVLSSLENAEMVQNLAKAYSSAPRNIGGSCVTVVTKEEKSGVAAEEVAAGFPNTKEANKPSIWLPDSSLWADISRASHPGNLRNAGAQVAYSDIVLGMPESLVTTIGWDTTTPTWQEIFETAGDPDVWSNLGHPEWGSFKLGKTSPTVATSGGAAMLTAYGAASGTVGDLSEAKIDDPKVRSIVREYELSTSHYMVTPQHFLRRARAAEASGSSADFLSAMIVDEKSVWDYNRGIVSPDGETRVVGEPPKDPLVPVYPADGYYTADNPAMVLSGAWVNDKTAAAAEDFVRFTSTIEGQTAVRESGYRDLNRMLDAEVTQVGRLQAQATDVLAMPRNRLVTAVQSSFPDVRKRANVLFLLDVSGSMDIEISDTDTRLTLAKKAVKEALDHFTPGDQVGLAAFAQSADGKFVPGTLTPVADIGVNRADLLSALNSIESMGDTPLYEAIDRYTKEQAKIWSSDRINAIVLLSDGEDDTNTPTTTEKQMNATLQKLHTETPVLVFTLGYSDEADVAALQAIASSTGAHYYDATDPLKLRQVLGDLVTSF